MNEMNEWMNEWNEWMNEWMSEMNEQELMNSNEWTK